MPNLMTYSEACTRFANLATTGISIEDAIIEAVDRIYEMGRFPGTTVEITLTEADFELDTDVNSYFLFLDDETYDGAIGFRSNGRGWGIVDQSVLYKDGINAGDMEFVDYGTVNSGSGVGFSSLQVDPSGGNNTLTFTSTITGSAGALTSVTIASAVSSSETDVSVAGQAITITPGTKARMIITGTLSPDATIEVYAIQRPPAQFQLTDFYYDSGDSYPRVTIYQDYLIPWRIYYYPDSDSYPSSPTGRWEAHAGAFTYPSDATGWNTQIGTGTPTVTAATSNASQAIEAIEASSDVLSLVTVFAEGSSTGALDSFPQEFLVLSDSFSAYRKYRAPLGFAPDQGPYYALMKLDAPELEDSTIIQVPIGPLKCAVLAVCQEYVNDDERALLNWQKFDNFMTRSERQTHGPKRWTIGIDCSLRRRPSQFS